MVLASLKDGCRFFSTLTFRKIWNAIRIYIGYGYSLVSGYRRHPGMPFSMSVEPATSCNLRCPECPSGQRSFARPTGHMSFADLKRYIDEASPYLLNVMLYFQGEPMLNKDFFRFVEYARSKNVYTMTSTNGHFLDEENSRNIVTSGLDRLIISYDGTTQDVYERYRREGILEKVHQGIRNILEEKKRQKKHHPRIILQFLVMGHNEHQMEHAREYAASIGVELQFKSAQVYDTVNHSWIIPVLNLKYSRYRRDADGKYAIKSRLPDRCFRMWTGLVVTWDGDVVPCCFDKDAQWVMGNLKDRSLREIWESDIYNEFRHRVFSDRKSLDICRNCTEGLG